MILIPLRYNLPSGKTGYLAEGKLYQLGLLYSLVYLFFLWTDLFIINNNLKYKPILYSCVQTGIVIIDFPNSYKSIFQNTISANRAPLTIILSL